jgi:hypothetical protein
MDLFNFPPGANLLPPDQVRILKLRAEPWPDGRRVKVFIELTPFEQKPSMDLTIFDMQGEELAYAAVIETMVFRLVITLHLPPEIPPGTYRLNGSLYYPEQPPVHTSEILFDLPENTETA